MPMDGHADAHAHSGQHTHGTQGWGDTIFGPELRLADGPGYHLQINPMSAPDRLGHKQMDGVFTHYGMPARLRHLGFRAEHRLHGPRRSHDLGAPAPWHRAFGR